MGYRSSSRAELRAEADFQQQEFHPKAREHSYKLGESTRISRWRSWLLTRARLASDPDVRERFIAIARHGRRQKLSKALLIKRQTKRADNHASLQDVVRDHLLAATGVKRCTSRTSAKTRAGFVVFAIGSDPNRSACCTVAISSWPLHNQKMRSFATAHDCGIPSIPTHYSNRVGSAARNL
jgi:hypothetical protein